MNGQMIRILTCEVDQVLMPPVRRQKLTEQKTVPFSVGIRHTCERILRRQPPSAPRVRPPRA